MFIAFVFLLSHEIDFFLIALNHNWPWYFVIALISKN